jgi:hypothetical protein
MKVPLRILKKSKSTLENTSVIKERLSTSAQLPNITIVVEVPCFCDHVQAFYCKGVQIDDCI